MVKETKFFRKQADKAERMTRSATDVEISQRYRNMAHAYRSQADVLKAKKKPERTALIPNAREAIVSKLTSVALGGVLSVVSPNFVWADQPEPDWMPAQQVIEKALNSGYTEITELKADDGP